MTSGVVKAAAVAGFAGLLLGAAAISAALYLRGGAVAPVPVPEAMPQTFQAIADSRGMAGLTAPPPAKIEVVPAASGGVPEVRLSGVQSNAPSADTPGIWIQVPAEFERAASGQTVRVTVVARPADNAPNHSFAVAYSTSEVGNSGWRRFTLGEGLQNYSFVYDVAPMVNGYNDHIGILPDPEGTDGAVQVAAIRAEAFARGAPMPPLPPPPAAAPEATPVTTVASASAEAPATTPATPATADSKGGVPTPDTTSQPHNMVSSAYYDIAVEKVKIPQVGRRGGIALLGKGLFIATRDGGTYFLPDLSTPSADSVVALKEKLPFDLSSPKLKRFSPDTLSVLGAAAEPSTTAKGDAWDLYVSMYEFDEPNDCVAFAMYRATVNLVAGRDPDFVQRWQRIFRSNPCRPLSDMSNEGSLFEAGGRIALDKDGILMTLGLGSSVRRKDGEDFDPSTQAYTQRDTHDFGKILRIDRNTLAVTHIAKGFRNPQGLLVDDDGTIFMTEQGPQGGDELNIVEQGGNYGWPVMTYGTQYGERNWIFKAPKDTSIYREPLFAFVPSVSVTELVRIKGDQFPKWKGNLIATSLTGGSSGVDRGLSLFRFHYSDGRIIYVEPITLGWRMRDIVEAPDGRLVILTDDKYVLIVSNATQDQAPADQAPAAAVATPAPAPAVTLSAATEGLPGRGVFADKCSSCHGLQPGNPDAIAPALGCAVGSNVASTDGYAYSAGLKQRAGVVWDDKNLATYIKNPESFAPGAKMAPPQVSEAEIGDVIAFLTAYKAEACR